MTMARPAKMPTWDELTPEQQHDLDRLFRFVRNIKPRLQERLRQKEAAR